MICDDEDTGEFNRLTERKAMAGSFLERETTYPL